MYFAQAKTEERAAEARRLLEERRQAAVKDEVATVKDEKEKKEKTKGLEMKSKVSAAGKNTDQTTVKQKEGGKSSDSSNRSSDLKRIPAPVVTASAAVKRSRGDLVMSARERFLARKKAKAAASQTS